jgi:hypothetical protein
MPADKGKTAREIESNGLRSRESFEDCLNFVRNEVKCSGVFADVSEKDAKRLVETLVNDGMSPAEIHKRIVFSSRADFLFSVLYDKVCASQEKRMALLDALVFSSKDLSAGAHLDATFVAGKFSTAEDFQHLLDYHSHLLFYERDSSWLAKYFSADDYWLSKVRWYIAKKDHRRAWDEFRRAQKGFFIGPKNGSPRSDEIEPQDYCCAVTAETATMLVRELYIGMQVAGLLPDADDECAMMRLMAEHFRQERNARRRAKITKAVDKLRDSGKK